MSRNEDLEEKKLLGSGGYAFAKLTEQEELKANLGVPQIFLSNVGRLMKIDLQNTIAINAQKNTLVPQRLAMKIQMKN
jgi:hypothetical protein